ncbi:Sulfatase [Pirellulimonas nuda]|uniref:Sulfatase n=1 Tax=Pirellulimonas nuda TaxID=2528009 RepID=A0A518DHM6_9BACT|nr:sulfatase [Pirellulimonas nuda]QDU90980.1 Sulfatase [Pirellulimonas nuda]
MYRFLFAVVLLLLGPSLLSAADRPNILFFFADDWDCTAGVYARSGRPTTSDIVKTPNIDRIGREGVIFDNAFVQVSSCGPSRASLSTGRSFWRNGSRAFKGGDCFGREDDPYSGLPKFPDLLRESGYHVDKYWKTIDFQVSPGTPEKSGAPRLENVKVPRYGLHVSRGATEPERARLRQQVIDATRKVFLQSMGKVPQGKPFFFIFGPINTHRPYAAGSGQRLWGIDPEDLRERLPVFIPDVRETREDFADYLGEIQALDLMLGVILEELEASKKLVDTLVILSGDNGMPGVPRGKTTCFDLGVKAPLMMRLPGLITPGRRVQDFVTVSDIAPTLLDLTGEAVPETMDAESFLTQITSKKDGWIDPARDHVFTGRERHCMSIVRDGFLPYPIRSVRSKDYLYVRNFKSDRTLYGDEKYNYADMDSSPTKSLLLSRRDSPLFRLHFEHQPDELLFEIDSDPHCMENLVGKQEAMRALERHRALLDEKMRSTADPRLDDSFDRMPWVEEVTSAKAG